MISPSLPDSELASSAPARLLFSTTLPPATILWKKRKGRGDPKLLGEGMMTNQAAQCTDPVPWAPSLHETQPLPSAKLSSSGTHDLVIHAPNSPTITSNYPSPTTLRPRPAEANPPHLHSPGSIPLKLALTVGDWARPSWLLRCRPSPPLLLHAPASQSQPPSWLARSRSCACAARSARGPLRQLAPAHLAPGASFSVPDGRLLWVPSAHRHRLALGT